MATNTCMIIGSPFDEPAELVPAGEYYLADPCYIIDNHDNYMRIVGLGDGIKTHGVVVLNTMYGDGTFFDQFGNEYGVDTGSIALISVSVSDSNVSRKKTPVRKHRGFTMQEKTLKRNPKIELEGHIYDRPAEHTIQMVTFTKPTLVFRKSGVMHFGEIQIDVA